MIAPIAIVATSPDPELVDDVIGRSRISGERREDRLNKKIVAAMQNRRRPKAPLSAASTTRG